MDIAIFGKKTFQVSGRKIYTFNDFSLGGQLNTESQDVAGKKPSTYIKGAGLNSMSFNIPLDASLNIDVRAEYESWETIMNTGVAYAFILGGKPIGSNKWLLKSVDLSNVQIDAKGTWLKGMLNLQFDEYVRPGSVAATTTTKSGDTSKAPAVVAKGSVNKSAASKLLAGEDKSLKKRENRNMITSMIKGFA